MGTFRVRRPYNRRYGDFDIDTLFWGALIFLALFVSCFLVWKAIEWLRNGTKPSAPSRANTSAAPKAAADAGTDLSPLARRHMKDLEDHPRDPYDPSVAPSWARYGDEGSAMAGMNEREEEEFFLAFGTRKHRNAIKERRKARKHGRRTS
jgi:hypothetical protein